MTDISFEDFIYRVDSLYSQNPTLVMKYGQCVMNILSEVKPEKYNELVKSNLDYFYDDISVSGILDQLQKSW